MNKNFSDESSKKRGRSKKNLLGKREEYRKKQAHKREGFSKKKSHPNP